jgi:hypothetical protein
VGIGGAAGAAAGFGLAAGLRAAGLAVVAGLAGVAAGAAWAGWAGGGADGHGDVAWANTAVEAAVPRANASANVEPKRIPDLPLSRPAL